MMEFHVSRAARDRHGFDESLFALSGNVILPNFPATRRFAQLMNAGRDVTRHPDRTILAGHLNAMGLVDEILHHVVGLYRERANPGAMTRALAALQGRLGRDAVEATLAAFVEAFPTTAVYRGDAAAADYLDGDTDGVPNREVALEELLLLWLANANPACGPFAELFDDADLRRATGYAEVVAGLETFFESEPPFGPGRQDLVTMLRSPAVEVPDSLPGQLRYIRERWGLLLEGYLDRLVIGLDVLSEEERAHWLRFRGGAGDGRTRGEGPGLGGGSGLGSEFEPERFSVDLDWMPRLVLIAKSTYVWLDQLSRAHGREIRTLDAIPDAELDRLAHWGITGLWLIGLWERSRASQRIKQLRGNPDAVASAYSLMDYRIADDLGGDAAYQNLRGRAWARGIRLASDMVPNHMGIDSTWVIEHPDWFLSLPYPPYPSYSYTGPDLSGSERVGIFLEDHYWDATDAAVTFKRLDRSTGDERYVYHGNDGTSFPWNDTAQLDYLRADVREAVIRTILDVARRFSVIRFDAAMTLAKRHVQRLWFPEPGSGGGIPSRAEHALTKAEFDALMPVEFWREVVDRVAVEAPDTLLLAEAFWMLEGYFVRTLGMHRVYNSAFMHMLRDEDNAGYRRVIRDTLEFDPEILKRYVNFMSNPDEKTAVEQFGKGDKYIGICTLMATLPGLPMFGHGQVEGFAEKYGMEYRRAYRDERPDEWLVGRHEREIFPLLHRRGIFAEAREFLLYDVIGPGGSVNEDVYAYSNRAGGERSLVVFHNRFGDARGSIRTSVAYAEKGADGGKALRRRSLADGLGLPADDDAWLVFRDAVSGLEYLRNCGAIVRDGLYVELDAYRCHVFLGFREVADGRTHQYRRLSERIGGAGVPSVDDALRELQLEPVHAPLRAALEPGLLRGVAAGEADALDEAERRCVEVLGAVAAATGTQGSGADREAIARFVRAELAAIARLADVAEVGIGGLEAGRSGGIGGPGRRESTAPAIEVILGQLASEPAPRSVLAAWALVGALGRLIGASEDAAAYARTSRAWLDELRLAPVIAAAFRQLGLDEGRAWRAVDLVRVLVTLPRRSTLAGDGRRRGSRIIDAWLADEDVRPFIRVNAWEGVAWFEKEAFEGLTAWMLVLDAVEAGAGAGAASGAPGTAGAGGTMAEATATEATTGAAPPSAGLDPAVATVLRASMRLVRGLRAAGEASGYRVDRLAKAARPAPAARPRSTARATSKPKREPEPDTGSDPGPTRRARRDTRPPG